MHIFSRVSTGIRYSSFPTIFLITPSEILHTSAKAVWELPSLIHGTIHFSLMKAAINRFIFDTKQKKEFLKQVLRTIVRVPDFYCLNGNIKLWYLALNIALETGDFLQRNDKFKYSRPRGVYSFVVT